MLRWLLKKKMKSVLEHELTDAMSVLSSMRQLLHKEGSELTMIYGQGIGETAGLLAQRFHISVPNAIEGKGLDWRQLDDAYRDLIKGIETMRPHLQSKKQYHAHRSAKDDRRRSDFQLPLPTTLPKNSGTGKANGGINTGR